MEKIRPLAHKLPALKKKKKKKLNMKNQSEWSPKENSHLKPVNGNLREARLSMKKNRVILSLSGFNYQQFNPSQLHLVPNRRIYLL